MRTVEHVEIIENVRADGSRPPYEVRRPVCDRHGYGWNGLTGPPEPEMIRSTQAAAIIGVTGARLEAWRRNGRGPGFAKRGVRFWYKEADVRAFAMAHSLIHGRTRQGAPAAMVLICRPACGVCGQEEDPFPSVHEAERVLGSYGWHHRTAGMELWYCPPCRSHRDSDVRRSRRGRGTTQVSPFA